MIRVKSDVINIHQLWCIRSCCNNNHSRKYIGHVGMATGSTYGHKINLTIGIVPICVI